MEYIEVRAKTVDLAVEAAMQELGVTDREELEVQVLSEPVKGFLGMGGEDAVVRIERKRRSRGRNRRKAGGKPENTQRSKPGNSRDRQQGNRDSGKNGSRQSRPKSDGRKAADGSEKTLSDDRPVLPIEEQATLVQEFLEGLVEAYGLEGAVTTTVDDDVIVADVSGDQTEALVGVRGTVRAAVHELSRTVLQRYGQDSARLRLDIAGYAERRRQALSIYAEQLISELIRDGGEIMLEPMSPADRKVIHDIAASHSEVTSYSEGEPPRRYVVLSRVDEEE